MKKLLTASVTAVSARMRSSPTISTWIQTIWKLPTNIAKNTSVDRSGGLSTVKRSALCWRPQHCKFLSAWSIWKNSRSIVSLKLFAEAKRYRVDPVPAQGLPVWHQPKALIDAARILSANPGLTTANGTKPLLGWEDRKPMKLVDLGRQTLPKS